MRWPIDLWPYTCVSIPRWCRRQPRNKRSTPTTKWAPTLRSSFRHIDLYIFTDPSLPHTYTTNYTTIHQATCWNRTLSLSSNTFDYVSPSTLVCFLTSSTIASVPCKDHILFSPNSLFNLTSVIRLPENTFVHVQNIVLSPNSFDPAQCVNLIKCNRINENG